MKNSYSKEFTIKASPNRVFKSITLEIDKWWTKYANTAAKQGDELTVKFGKSTFKTMELIKVVPNQTLHWYVKQANIDVEGLLQKNEWVGTTILWEIETLKNGSKITFTHKGLIPDFECYDICEKGWGYFLESLRLYLENGKGTPAGAD